MTAEILMAVALLCNHGSIMREGQAMKAECQRELILCVNEARQKYITEGGKPHEEGELLARCVLTGR